MNSVNLMGRLGADPEIRYSNDGKPVGNLRMATGSGDYTEWHRIVIFGKQAETCAEYLKKGSQVGVEGRLQTRTWEDKSGNKRSTTEVVAHRVHFGGRKREEPRDAYEDGF